MAKITVETLVEKELKKRGKDGAVEFLSRSFQINHDPIYLSACANFLPHYYDTPDKFLGLYWCIRSQLFVYSGQLEAKALNKILYGKLARYFFRFAKQISEKVSCEAVITNDDNVDRIVVMVTQFLKPPHSPTLAAAEFAKRFQEHNDKDVLIVDVSEIPTKQRSTFHPQFWANRINDTGFSKYEFDGSTLDLYTAPNDVIDAEKAQLILNTLSNFAPDTILVVGDSIASAEIASHFWPVICWPSTQTEPISSAPVQIYRSKEPHKPQIDWKKLKLEPPQLVPQDFDTQNNIPNTKNIDRETLNIPEDAFVFVLVGARIKYELSPEFQDILTHIIQTDPKVFILIVGTDDFDITPNLHTHKNRLRLVKYTKSLRALIGVCDVFLNPPRQGGGGAAYLAVLESLPIVTLEDCDVQMTILNDAAVANLAELEKLAKAMITDENKRNEYIEKSKQRLADFMTPQESSERLLSHLRTTKKVFLSK
jgi:hypothetical protein